MSSKPFFTDEQVQQIVWNIRRADTDELALDLQRARAEARGRKADQASMKATDTALERLKYKQSRRRVTKLEAELEVAYSMTDRRVAHLLTLRESIKRLEAALKAITDPDLPSLATAAQIAKEALKDG